MMFDERTVSRVNPEQPDVGKEALLSVSELNTVPPGPLDINARYADSSGSPIFGATLTITGSSKCLPVNMVEGISGRYSGVVHILPDSDGRRDTLQVTAHKNGYQLKVAHLTYFTEDTSWIVRNDHVERQLMSWASDFPRYISLDKFITYEGYSTYAVTVTDKTVSDRGKNKILFTQSHAHEPGGTAATMETINQLLTGMTQEGNKSTVNNNRILRELLIVFIPTGNSSGRERSPLQYWCDQYDKEQMNRFIYGKLASEPHQWHESPSILYRDKQKLDPSYPIALRYEQISDDTFVEPFFSFLPFVPLVKEVDPADLPNIVTNPETKPGYHCGQGRLVKTMLDQQEFDAAIDLHQMTTSGDYGQVHIREQGLPGYNAKALEYAHSMASKIEEDGIRTGHKFADRRLINRLNWPPNITDFIHFYGRGNPASFLVEVTKGPGTTKIAQKAIAVSAILSALGYLLDNPR